MTRSKWLVTGFDGEPGATQLVTASRVHASTEVGDRNGLPCATCDDVNFMLQHSFP